MTEAPRRGAAPGTARAASRPQPKRSRPPGRLRSRLRSIRETGTHSDLSRQRAVPRLSERGLFRLSGGALLMVGVLLIGLVVQVVGVSVLREARDQALLYEEFRAALATGVAPVGQVDSAGELHPLGTPVALLEIPELGIREVVLEGTTSSVMLSGPGHRRDTVLPGQIGSSVIMGRHSTYGGPFSGIADLDVGETFTVTTGQGESTYQVTGQRLDVEDAPPDLEPGAGRLTLVSAHGFPFLPEGILRVDANLISTPYPTPAPVLLVGSLTESEGALAGDPSGWLPLLLLLELAVAVIWLFTLARRRWGSWHAWIVAVPVMLVVGTAVAEQFVVLLPNLF